MLLICEESDNVILTKKSWPINPKYLLQSSHSRDALDVRDLYDAIFAYGRAVLEPIGCKCHVITLDLKER